MNLIEIQKFMRVVERYSPDCFINSKFELIIEPKNNIFLLLEDVETEWDIKRKVLAWLSRPSCKGVSKYWQKRFRAIINEYLGTNFTADDMDEIYTYLGNDCNRKKTIMFIDSGYDLSLLNSN
ncbi:hypothetical protein G7L40_20410 [Paenibacillus polymyxa]|uniref:Uncharacterized protein n=1 Tax=Paenibacillus polymyxa TaxID=1406 RepID=A0A378XYW0_PAEPO|nr:hypothetical protein [Paenibacillus polymyxa]MBE7896147.1 hypothetical protein [Paenibacillus polymyxa]MBG9765909.1 hypothetical protein [Paenibacillus polymyxa]MCC3256677.1 hypothetical protein [Paenibacillus polymyxa]QPK54832.1 hypothetical protein G7035_20455 [Paenibacillus polymyxa]QPK59923.1 hypothetical protein G7L40_20410 [Paenibacillus polymyxa]